jgi:hypothetical protein
VASWWVTLLVGLAVLLLGRRLFWLFVGAAGFAVGLHVAPAVWPASPEWVAVLAAVVLGIVGAVLAVVFQWLAVGLGGFAAGVHGGLAAASALGLAEPWLWAAAFVSGIVGAALVLWLWDPILILLSALIGGALLTPLIKASPAARPWMFLGLVVVGIVVQASLLAPPEGATRPARGRRA